MNIVSVIEGLFDPEAAAIQTFARTVAADVVGWLKGEEQLVIADALAWWGRQKAIIGQFSAGQLAIVQTLVASAAADAAAGDFTAIEAAVMTQAAARELTWITSLGQAELSALVALLSYTPAPAAAPAPVTV